MHTLKIVVAVLWIVFFAYWFLSALRSKRGTRATHGLPLRAILAVALLLFFRLVHADSFAVHDVPLAILGTAIVVCGLAFAVWARLHIGRNWGMPMSQKEEPELVTSGPYRFVRHPIYTGILVAVVGTALVVNLLALAVAAVIGAFFYYSATVEERNLGATFPGAYPAYKARTKMLIPFVL
jgi:protein-S-isoprenylcysteine O-methyltransferase Ste14